MSMGGETRRAFDRRTRDVLIEEIMARRWQLTTLRIELEDAAKVLESRSKHLREVAQRVTESHDAWGKV